MGNANTGGADVGIDIKWASRWDVYLRSSEDESIEWFGIINSLIIAVFLAGMIGVILVRTLHRDISRYNEVRFHLFAVVMLLIDMCSTQQDNSDEAQEEFGWKLVHGDVFRPPADPILFSTILGNGSQVLSMFFITLLFACFGFLSPGISLVFQRVNLIFPANRGGLMTSAVVLYFLFSSVAGYVTARFYKVC